MKTPPIPNNELARLDSLYALRILDTEEERTYDQLTKLASHICQSPISLISLVDKNRQWFKSHHGLDARETDRDSAFCSYVVAEGKPLIVEDAHNDDRFKNNPLVIGAPHVTFYAGVPLRDEQGFTLGSLCVIDHYPRRFSPEQLEALQTLAHQVVVNFRLRREIEDKRRESMNIERWAKQVPGMIYQLRLRSDGSSHFPFASSGIEEVYEVNPDEVKDSADVVLDRTDSEMYASLLKSIHESAVNLTDWSMDYKVNLPKRGSRWLRGFARPERLDDGSTLWHGFISDVTETKLLENTISDQRTLMLNSSKLASMGEMAGGVAHEINNPLSIIMGKLMLMEKEIRSDRMRPEKLIEDIEKIQKTGFRIEKIVKALRVFARDGSNDPFEHVKITEIIEETQDLCAEKFKNHGIEFRNSVDPNLVIYGQKIQLVQVLVNLLNNSFDAIQTLPHKWIHLHSAVHEDHITLSVTDSGSGIEDHIVEKLMNPFFTTKEVGKGTGLGLSISKGIAKLHKGDLVYDRDVENTTFKLILPFDGRNQRLAS